MQIWQTFRQIERYQQIATILLRNGFDNLIVAPEVKKHIHIPFTKPKEEILAQILSTRPDLILLELANAFSMLQDEVSPIPFSQIEQVFSEEFGKPVEAAF